jgi:integrase
MLRNHIIPALGRKPLVEITPADITGVFEPLGAASAKYRSNVYCLLRVMFDVAEQGDLIERSPVRSKLHKPECSREEKPQLSSTEVRMLLDQVDPAHRLLLLLIAVTGLRLSEALGFRWQDFEASAGTLSITHRLWRARLGPPKTKKSKAKIQLVVELVEQLANLQESSGFNSPEDFIFCKLDGASLDPDYLRREVLYPAMDRAGIKRGDRTHGFHILRHTAASLLHEKTNDLKGVQQFLRHSQIGTTADIYVHQSSTVVRKASELLANELDRVVVESKLVN